MKKIITAFILIVTFTGSAPSFAAETKNAPAAVPAAASASAQANELGPLDTPFNRISLFLSGFDRGFSRRGNKDGFWNATAKWMRGINKY